MTEAIRGRAQAETTAPGVRSLVSRVWPAAVGVLVAAGTAFGMEDGREAAPVVVASGFVYVAAAATGRRGAAWLAFGGTVVLITIAAFTGLDSTLWMLGLAAVLVVAGLVRGGIRPLWSLPLQTAAMLVLAGVAVLSVRADPIAGGVVAALALLAHAAWDVYHHLTGRVVGHPFAEFCAVLDVVLAGIVLVVALTP